MMVAMNLEQSDRLVELLGQVKKLAKEYYSLTGKPLGVTGEIAEFEAARLTGVRLCVARQEGYDAIRTSNGAETKVQVKGVCFPPAREASWRTGTIQLDKEWDVISMVLLTPDLEPREIWEADRPAITSLLTSRKRTDPGVKEVKQIGKKVWPL